MVKREVVIEWNRPQSVPNSQEALLWIIVLKSKDTGNRRKTGTR